jgi:lipopolysaccharide/colanic/teichoic acid biosynthesis glycosyltransferase
VNVLAFLVTAVLVPLLVNEFTDWLPWLAARLIDAAAHTMPSAARLRYAEEWLAELDAVPGKLSKLALAIRIFVRAPATAKAVRRVPSARIPAMKAVFDRTVAALLLVVVAPLLLAVWLAIQVGDRGPVLVRQTRIGQHGRVFTVWKFRTLVPDVVDPRSAPVTHNEDTGINFEVSQKPRITTVGFWLRRWSLDELPQLFNVVLGDMSFVGPPPLPVDAGQSSAPAQRMPENKPGLTGLWQISGRPEEDAKGLDRRYSEHWSLALDLQIIWRAWRQWWRDR